jgi:regulator of sigma E protease
MEVSEFSIGFGPAIYQKQGKETTFSIRIIPLGGYVAVLSDRIKTTIQNIQNADIQDVEQ